MSDDLVKRLRDPAFGTETTERNLMNSAADRIEQLEAKLSKSEALLAKAMEALDESVYLLAPDEKDMMRQAGVYRIVTTLAELKGETDE